ncbi:DUF58 domain-containing protein, partial [Algiphilus sp.]|uniref:DUF58 domain-containing protein n=1 Tax=Algiphilus sp. TaxID=1872431 RepID=UPI003BA860F9
MAFFAHGHGYGPISGCWSTQPRTRAVRAFPQANHAEGEDSGRHLGREHFDSLRDYRHGDPRHDIHWKRLAKDSKPTVKQFLDTADRR